MAGGNEVFGTLVGSGTMVLMDPAFIKRKNKEKRSVGV